MQWQPIETLPANTPALLYLQYGDDGLNYCVDSWRWVEREQQEIVRQSRDETITRTFVVKERDWRNGGWSATHWMPLPATPAQEP